MRSKLDVGLLALATANPPHVLTQRDVVNSVRDIFSGQFSNFEKIASMFAATGIEERRATQPFEWYLQPHGWPERTAAYAEGALALFIEAASKALEAAQLSAEEVDTIVTVSSTGIATPSLEARAMQTLGFRSDILRVPVFGLGCGGGVAGLAIGADLAMARPGSVVLVVTIELCSLAVRLDEATKVNMVAMALFGDGAAAAVLTSRPDANIRLRYTAQHTWPDTLDIMGWKVDPVGFGVIFDQSIPMFTRSHLKDAIDTILNAQGSGYGEIDRFICHPGGRKVVEAIEDVLNVSAGTLDHEREILRQFGNMSAPTALFVLERAMNAGLPERSVVMALGPGFTISTATLVRH